MIYTSKLQSYFIVGIRATIAPSFGLNTDSARSFNPFLGRHQKCIIDQFCFNVVEFHHIKTGVMHFGNNKGLLEFDGTNWELSTHFLEITMEKAGRSKIQDFMVRLLLVQQERHG